MDSITEYAIIKHFSDDKIVFNLIEGKIRQPENLISKYKILNFIFISHIISFKLGKCGMFSYIKLNK